MAETQRQRSGSPRGSLTGALFGAGVADREDMVSLLDELIPLDGASHADVDEYQVEIPMCYAECFALLTDGRKVGLQNPRAFVGWSRHDRNRSLLFQSRGKHYEVAVEASLRGQVPGCIRTVSLDARSEHRSSPARKFIGIDGELVFLPELPA